MKRKKQDFFPENPDKKTSKKCQKIKRKNGEESVNYPELWHANKL